MPKSRYTDSGFAPHSAHALAQSLGRKLAPLGHRRANHSGKSAPKSSHLLARSSGSQSDNSGMPRGPRMTQILLLVSSHSSHASAGHRPSLPQVFFSCGPIPVNWAAMMVSASRMRNRANGSARIGTVQKSHTARRGFTAVTSPLHQRYKG